MHVFIHTIVLYTYDIMIQADKPDIWANSQAPVFFLHASRRLHVSVCAAFRLQLECVAPRTFVGVGGALIARRAA